MEIFAFFTSQQLANVSLVSKSWREIANSDYLWERIYRREFNELKKNSKEKLRKQTYKELYVATKIWRDFEAKFSDHRSLEERNGLWLGYQKLTADRKDALPIDLAKTLFGSAFVLEDRGFIDIPRQVIDKSFNDEIERLRSKLIIWIALQVIPQQAFLSSFNANSILATMCINHYVEVKNRL